MEMPAHLPWEESRTTLHWHAPGPDAPWFLQHALYAPIATTAIQARIYRLPPGHSSPEHRRDIDRIIVHVAGEVTWKIGSRRLTAKPFDVFVLPAGMPRSPFNPGVVDALFVVVYERRTAAEPAPERSDGDVPYLDWASYRRQVVWEQAGGGDELAARRGLFPAIEATAMTGRLVRVPSGYDSSLPVTGGESIVVGLRGDLELRAGSTTYSLGALDLMAATPLLSGPRNLGLGEGLYFTVAAKESP
jgi:quercetin dioxygenase-like cupin family protein